MNIKNSLAYKIKEYVKKDIYPFHMPGHKRNMPKEIKDLFYDIAMIDVTELDDTDALHYPNGIIQESMEYVSKIYKSNKSYFLINGSTCGILSSIRALYKNDGKKILIDRNSHISAFHALELCNIDFEYLDSRLDDKLDISLGIDVSNLKEKLLNNNFFAVYITSPTYEGVVSDIEYISDISHEFNIPVIVDEAHGAHLFFMNKYIEKYSISSAIGLGADIVIQSTHKTLPSFTQTAILHVKSQMVDFKILEDNLRIFQSSSPSYIFMSSIDLAIRYMNEKNDEIKKYYRCLNKFRESVGKLKNIGIWNYNNKNLDIGKLVLFMKFEGEELVDGKIFQALLREKYKIEIEMAKPKYILAMTSLCDTEESFDILLKALEDIDNTINRRDLIRDIHAVDIGDRIKELKSYLGLNIPRHIYVYPPGIPIVFKDEILLKEHIDLIEDYIKKGYNIQGI